MPKQTRDCRFCPHHLDKWVATLQKRVALLAVYTGKTLFFARL